MKLLYIAMISIFAFISCEKQTGESNEAEVITTVQLTFIPQGGGTAVEYKFDDPDGPGGNVPVIDNIVLSANKMYDVTIRLLNKTVTPEEDITGEVADEADAHRFYYLPSAGSNITVSGFDNDPDGVPVGIASVWTTGAPANGTIKILLRHYAEDPPAKAINDPFDSDKSSTDVEVEFVTKVQ